LVTVGVLVRVGVPVGVRVGVTVGVTDWLTVTLLDSPVMVMKVKQPGPQGISPLTLAWKNTAPARAACRVQLTEPEETDCTGGRAGVKMGSV
jgi:hypothetical protein